MNVNVHGAGNARDALLEFLRQSIAHRGIPAGYLQVDWRRQAEIQNLIGDVRGFEKEHDSPGMPR